MQCYLNSIKLAAAWLEYVPWFIYFLHGSCMLSFAKVFQFLVLRLIGKCAVLSLIANPLPFSFSISYMSCGEEYSALGMFVMQVLLGCCIVDVNF